MHYSVSMCVQEIKSNEMEVENIGGEHIMGEPWQLTNLPACDGQQVEHELLFFLFLFSVAFPNMCNQKAAELEGKNVKGTVYKISLLDVSRLQSTKFCFLTPLI